MNSTRPSPPTVGSMLAQLFATQTLPDWSTWTAVRCWRPPLLNPVIGGGDHFTGPRSRRAVATFRPQTG